MQKFSEIKYVRPDYESYKAQMKARGEKLAAAKSYEEARALFLENEKQGEELACMSTVAYIRNTMDTRDPFYEQEMNYEYEESPKIELAQKEFNELLLASPFRRDFEREFGENFLKDIEAQQRLADNRIISEKVEESKLGQEYSKTVTGCSVNFRGEECNFYGLLKHMLSTDRAERKEAFLLWAKLYEGVSDKLDEIFCRMVRLRKTMAKKLGFDNYAEMAYLMNGHYDYGAKEVASFRDQVLKEVVPVAGALYEEQRKRLGIDRLHYYDEQLIYPEGNAAPIGDRETLVNSAVEMYHALSKETGEFIDFMKKYELYDLDTRPGKHMGGYCTMFPGWNAPFIFSNFNGSSADVDVLTHEAGHAFEGYTASRNMPFAALATSTNDINEIHSMSMEHFAYPYMDKFFGENADKYRYAHLSEALKAIPYLCLVDHFQHEVYAHDFHAKELRACWRELEKQYLPWRDYDGNAFLEEGGFWMQKQHIFLFPFYYVDYALSQMGAFEFYCRAKEDRASAWADYYRLCRAGGSKPYFELLKLANLSNPFAEGTVKRVISPIREELLGK